MIHLTTNKEAWPELEWDQWKDTAGTLHMIMQMVGKTTGGADPGSKPLVECSVLFTARGLTTSAMPVAGGGLLDIEFDFHCA